MNRKRLTLGILLILLLLALLYALWQTPRQRKVGEEGGGKRATTAGATKSSAADEERVQIPRLREDLLDRKPEAYAGVQRNLFYAFHREEVEVKAPPIVVAPPPPPPPVAPSVPEPPPPPTPQQLATQELARFTFLGFLKKEADKTIFLAAEGEIFLVHKGDRFGRKREFFVTDVTTARLVIRQEEVGEIVVPLVDQEALKPASFSGAASSSASPGTAAPPPSLPARSWGRSSDVPVPVPVPTPDETQPNEAENEN